MTATGTLVAAEACVRQAGPTALAAGEALIRVRC